MNEGRRTAAVLVPVFRDAEGRLRIVLIVRTDRGLHGGQLGLPGGKVDDVDESLTATALREAEEEIGLTPADVQVLAELAPVRSGPTAFEVHPFLARIPDEIRWRPNADEVVEVLTPAVDELWDPAIRRELLFTSAHLPSGLLVDGIPVGERVLWGMTLRVLDDVVPRLLAGEWEAALR
ncbi:MAG: CoA pyrophosphatase [Actinobacteria bacterium]|nr:CoA pyrophosphatase [Actinomycetota bacterium]